MKEMHLPSSSDSIGCCRGKPTNVVSNYATKSNFLVKKATAWPCLVLGIRGHYAHSCIMSFDNKGSGCTMHTLGFSKFS